MEIILQDNIRGLGKLGDKVMVRPGFARNFLFPQGKAKIATQQNIKEFNQRRTELERASTDKMTAAQGRVAALKELDVTIAARAGDEGKLFGSVGPREIVKAIKTLGVKVDKREIVLNDGPIRVTGTHEISVRLHSEVTATVKIAVVGQ